MEPKLIKIMLGSPMKNDTVQQWASFDKQSGFLRR